MVLCIGCLPLAVVGYDDIVLLDQSYLTRFLTGEYTWGAQYFPGSTNSHFFTGSIPLKVLNSVQFNILAQSIEYSHRIHYRIHHLLQLIHSLYKDSINYLCTNGNLYLKRMVLRRYIYLCLTPSYVGVNIGHALL